MPEELTTRIGVQESKRARSVVEDRARFVFDPYDLTRESYRIAILLKHTKLVCGTGSSSSGISWFDLPPHGYDAASPIIPL